jgi:RNA polymerase sigma-70 factor (ECF subfamily)
MTDQPSTTNIRDNAPPTDWELVTLAQAGETTGRDAFGDLYDRHHEMVFRYIAWRLDPYDPDLAGQMAGEVWLRALRRIQSVTNRGDGKAVGAWVVTIARNLLLDHVKSGRHRWDRTVPEVAEPLSREKLAKNEPEHAAIANAMTGFYAQHLTPCLRKLSPEQRECIGLRFYAGLSVTETAEVMRRNEGAVKALQHRAIRRLAQLLPADASSWLTDDVGVAS